MSININTELIKQIRQLKRGKNTLIIIEKELRRLGIYKTHLTPYAYYLMSFKFWDKDFVMAEISEELHHVKDWKDTDDIDLFICMNVLKGEIVI